MRKNINNCHICGSKNLFIFEEFATIPRVSSDCKPWKSGGSLAICKDCITLQKVIDQFWNNECKEIYSNYNLYYQSKDGSEQFSFDINSGSSNPRSVQIIKLFNEILKLTSNSKVLDIGCGTGAMLRAISLLDNNWELYGYEPNIKNINSLKNITKVKDIYKKTLEEINIKFNLITLIHVIEHIVDPRKFLKIIRDKMSEDGVLLIQIPYFYRNIFDLLITDHCTHFNFLTIKNLLEICELEIIYHNIDIIEKEMMIIARKKNNSFIKITHNQSINNNVDYEINIIINYISKSLSCFNELILHAKTISHSDYFGIFGTSISANWLYPSIAPNVDFFVDEDPNRIGRVLYDKIILSPSQINIKSDLFFVLPYTLANKIINRLILPDYINTHSYKKFPTLTEF